MAADIVLEIKQRTDIVELISAYVPLKQSGQAFKGLCPFHGEKSPSFHVNRERGMYKCFGCGVGGDCFKFIQQKEGLSFNEAGELLARRVGLEWVRKGETAEKRSQREQLYDLCALAERFFRQSLEASPEVKRYLLGRGLQEETIELFHLGYAPPGYEALTNWLKRNKVSIEDAVVADVLMMGEYGPRDRFVDRLIFPIFDLEGRPIAFGGRTLKPDGVPKYLNSKETPIFHKGRTLYGLHLAKRAIPEAGFVVAVEGYMDLIALHQAGVSNSIASLGTAMTDAHVAVLKRYSRELVVCYDGDSAGMRAAERNSSMFEVAECDVRVASLPKGEDPDTYISTHGADAFRALLHRAEPLLDFQLNRLRSGYNLADESARLPFVREAARIVAQSSSHLTRQAYGGKLTGLLDRLAEEWYPGDPHRAMQARTALTQEVNRLLRTDRMNGARPSHQPPPAVRTPEAPPSGRTRQERYVLRAALLEDRWADLVASRLTTEHFVDAGVAPIAQALFGTGDAAGAEALDSRAERLRGDPESAELVSSLLFDEAPVSDEGLEECLQALERAWKTNRRTLLRRLIESGKLPEGDPRVEEYRALVAELGGRQRRED